MVEDIDKRDELLKSKFLDVHTMPDNGKHECSSQCFCNPIVLYHDCITDKKVWLHKSEEELNQ